MDRLQIDGMEIPLLEPAHRDNDTPRRILNMLFYVLFKRKFLITAVFLVVSLPVLILFLFRPREYIATSKVLLKSSRTFLNLSPTSGDNSFSVSPSMEMMNSEIQIIRSRELLERLYKEVPFSKENKRKVTAEALGATPMRGSNIIQISQISSDPEWAARMVNRAAEIYMEQHLKFHKTPGIEEFYEDQEKKLQIELTKAETALKEFQEKDKIVDAGQELTSNLGRLAAFETNLKTTESSIRETNERIRILEAQLKEQPEIVSSSKHLTSSPVYNQIRKLELERDSLLQRYTAQDRLVMDKEKEIAELRNRLKREGQKVVEGESLSLNAIHQGILNSLLSARAELTSLEARRSSLLRQVASYSSGAAELKNKSFAYDRLQQEVNAKKEALALYKRKAEEARISDAMDERKFSNATILEKASLPLPLAGRPLWIIVLITIVLSLAVGLAGAFAIEFFNTTLRNEADVEEQIGLPVLATVQDYKELTAHTQHV